MFGKYIFHVSVAEYIVKRLFQEESEDIYSVQIVPVV
jgi:hypothetical protein